MCRIAVAEAAVARNLVWRSVGGDSWDNQSCRIVLSAQRKYADAKHRQSQIGLTIPEAFVRGIRHIGYRSNVDAIAELVDNSIQAYSLRVDLLFDYDKSVLLKKPSRLAVIDDGHGMAPEMLRLAMMWGGTHRENDRGGLGRYGYGLPCSAVSIGRRFTIISKVSGGQLFAVTLDLDALYGGKFQFLLRTSRFPGSTGKPASARRRASQAHFSRRMAFWHNCSDREA